MRFAFPYSERCVVGCFLAKKSRVLFSSYFPNVKCDNMTHLINLIGVECVQGATGEQLCFMLYANVVLNE